MLTISHRPWLKLSCGLSYKYCSDGPWHVKQRLYPGKHYCCTKELVTGQPQLPKETKRFWLLHGHWRFHNLQGKVRGTAAPEAEVLPAPQELQKDERSLQEKSSENLEQAADPPSAVFTPRYLGVTGPLRNRLVRTWTTKSLPSFAEFCMHLSPLFY